MPLEKKTISLPMVAGIDEGNSEISSPNPSPLDITNVRVDKAGRMEKRKGLSKIAEYNNTSYSGTTIENAVCGAVENHLPRLGYDSFSFIGKRRVASGYADATKDCGYRLFSSQIDNVTGTAEYSDVKSEGPVYPMDCYVETSGSSGRTNATVSCATGNGFVATVYEKLTRINNPAVNINNANGDIYFSCKELKTGKYTYKEKLVNVGDRSTKPYVFYLEDSDTFHIVCNNYDAAGATDGVYRAIISGAEYRSGTGTIIPTVLQNCTDALHEERGWDACKGKATIGGIEQDVIWVAWHRSFGVTPGILLRAYGSANNNVLLEHYYAYGVGGGALTNVETIRGTISCSYVYNSTGTKKWVVVIFVTQTAGPTYETYCYAVDTVTGNPVCATEEIQLLSTTTRMLRASSAIYDNKNDAVLCICEYQTEDIDIVSGGAFENIDTGHSGGAGPIVNNAYLCSSRITQDAVVFSGAAPSITAGIANSIINSGRLASKAFYHCGDIMFFMSIFSGSYPGGTSLAFTPGTGYEITAGMVATDYLTENANIDHIETSDNCLVLMKSFGYGQNLAYPHVVSRFLYGNSLPFIHKYQGIREVNTISESNSLNGYWIFGWLSIVDSSLGSAVADYLYDAAYETYPHKHIPTRYETSPIVITGSSQVQTTRSYLSSKDIESSCKISDGMFVGGVGVSGHIGAMTLQDVGFICPPVIRLVSVANANIATGIGPAAPNNVERFIVIKSKKDKNGNRIYSQPTYFSVTNSLGAGLGATVNVDVSVGSPYITTENYSVEVYQLYTDEQYRKCNSISCDPTSYYAGFTVYNATTSLNGTEEIVYTTGASNTVIPQNLPDPCFSPVSYDGRIFAVSQQKRNRIIYTQKKLEGYSYSFAEQLYYDLSSPGEIKKIVVLNDKIIAFKERSISYFYGSGPNDYGQGASFSNEIIISQDIGCSNPGSILRTPDGIFFNCAGMFYVIGPDLSVVPVGTPIKDSADVDYVCSAYDASGKRSYWLSTMNTVSYESLIVCFDHEHRIWTKDTYQDTIRYICSRNETLKTPSGTIDGKKSAGGLYYFVSYNNDLVYIGGDTDKTGASRYDDLQATGATARSYGKSITTGWFKLNNISGLQRIYWISLIGKYTDAHTLNVDIYYDYDQSTVAEHIEKAYTSSTAPHEIRIKPARQKCQAIMLKIYDTAGSTLGASLDAIEMVVGIKSSTKFSGSRTV